METVALKDVFGRKLKLQEKVLVLVPVERRPTIKVGTITRFTSKTVQVALDTETAKFVSDKNGYINRLFLMPFITPAKSDEWKDAIGQGIHVDDQLITREVDYYGVGRGFRYAGKVTGFTAKRVKAILNGQPQTLHAESIIVCPQDIEFDRLIKKRAANEKAAQKREDTKTAAEAAMEPVRIDGRDGITPVKVGKAKTSAVMRQIGATCHGYYAVDAYQDYKYDGIKLRMILSGFVDEMNADITPHDTNIFIPNSAQKIVLADSIEKGPFAEAYNDLLIVYQNLVKKIDNQ